MANDTDRVGPVLEKYFGTGRRSLEFDSSRLNEGIIAIFDVKFSVNINFGDFHYIPGPDALQQQMQPDQNDSVKTWEAVSWIEVARLSTRSQIEKVAQNGSIYAGRGAVRRIPEDLLWREPHELLPDTCRRTIRSYYHLQSQVNVAAAPS